jgi:hypothetical protein
VRDPDLVVGTKAQRLARLASIVRDLRPVVIVVALHLAVPIVAAAMLGLVF